MPSSSPPAGAQVHSQASMHEHAYVTSHYILMFIPGEKKLCTLCVLWTISVQRCHRTLLWVCDYLILVSRGLRLLLYSLSGHAKISTTHSRYWNVIFRLFLSGFWLQSRIIKWWLTYSGMKNKPRWIYWAEFGLMVSLNRIWNQRCIYAIWLIKKIQWPQYKSPSKPNENVWI